MPSGFPAIIPRREESVSQDELARMEVCRKDEVDNSHDMITLCEIFLQESRNH